jgi:hypothetical protein
MEAPGRGLGEGLTARAIVTESAMSDTTYEIFQSGKMYTARITRLGNFVQEADGFESHADAQSWIAQAKRLAIIDEQKEPMTSAHLRIIG